MLGTEPRCYSSDVEGAHGVRSAMTNDLTRHLTALAVAAALMSCGATAMKRCSTNAECPSGQCLGSTCVAAGGSGGSGGGFGGGGGLGGAGGGSSDGGWLANGGETCAAATVVTLPSTLKGTTAGSANDLEADCTGAINDGPDQVFQVSVPPGLRLTATLTAERADGGLQYDPAVLLIQAPASNCFADDAGAWACLGSGDDLTSNVDVATWTNASTAAVDVFVVVDSSARPTSTTYTNRGVFTLDLGLDAPLAGDTCSSAPPLVTGVALTGLSLAGFGNDFIGAGVSCHSPQGPDRAWHLDVPAGQQLTVTLTPSGGVGTLDAVLEVSPSAAACDHTCLANADLGFDAEPETLTWTNTASTVQTVFVVVDSWAGASGTATFDLLATIAAPPAGETCSTATLLAGTLTSQTTVGFANDYQSDQTTVGCANFTSGPDRVYSLSVAGNQRVKVVASVDPDAGFWPSISFVEAPASTCEVLPRVCVGGADSNSLTVPPMATFFNTTNATRDLLVIIDSTATRTGTFDLSATATTPPADDTCTTATTAITTMGPLSFNHDLSGFERDYFTGEACNLIYGPDRVYKVEVPGGQRLSVTVTPIDGGMNPVLELVTQPAVTCDGVGRTCIASVNATGPGQSETLAWNAAPGPDSNVFLIVGSRAAMAGDSRYTLEANLTPATMGDVCERPIVVPVAGQVDAGGPLITGSFATFLRDYDLSSTSCFASSGPYALGSDAVYAVDVPAGQTLTATVYPDATADPVMAIVEDAAQCHAAGVCLSAVDVGYDGEPETVSWANVAIDGGVSTRRVLIIVGAYVETSGGYSLEVLVH